MNRESFKFELTDKDLPDEVVRRTIRQIETATDGYVVANIAKYNGPIQSYTKKSGLISAIEAAQSATDFVDIQNDLGELNGEMHRYEVYLSVKRLEHYKYRILFMDYGTISYPVTIVLNEDLAKEYTGQNKYVFYVRTMNELEDMMNKIINSKFMKDFLQDLIDESLRRKYQEEFELEPGFHIKKE